MELQFAYINHWNEHGQLFGMKDGRGVEVNFYDDILWMTPSGTEIDAHEIKQIPNGNYMGITTEYQLSPFQLVLGPNHTKTLDMLQMDIQMNSLERNKNN